MCVYLVRWYKLSEKSNIFRTLNFFKEYSGFAAILLRTWESKTETGLRKHPSVENLSVDNKNQSISPPILHYSSTMLHSVCVEGAVVHSLVGFFFIYYCPQSDSSANCLNSRQLSYP